MNAPEQAGSLPPNTTESAGASGVRGLRIDPALRAELDAVYADAAAALDERRYDDWIDLFTDDCEYVLQPRENFDRSLPLATMAFESKGMLRDRIYAIGDTLFHAPYYQRHVVGPLRIVQADSDAIHVEANYAVFRTKVQQLSEVFNVGRYIDVLVPDPADASGWRIRSRRVVFDSELIPNSIIYPI
jgi:salicylate 5-hydroxylase small subunit